MMNNTVKRTKRISTGSLINKLERALAVAIMRGDREAEAKFTKALEAAINSTDAPAFLA